MRYRWLLLLLRWGPAETRVRAARALASFPTDEARTALVAALLHTPSVGVESAVTEALRTTGLGASGGRLADAVAAGSLDLASISRQFSARRLLASLDAFGDPHVVGGLLRRWRSPGPCDLRLVADTLVRSGAPEAIAALKQGVGSTDRDRRDAAVDALQETDWTPPVDCVADLVGNIRSGHPSAASAEQAIRKLGAAATGELLAVATRHLMEKEREVAIRLLADLGDARAIPFFLGRCVSPGSGEMRHAIGVLERILRDDAAGAQAEDLAAILRLEDSYSGVDVGTEADRYDTPVYYPWAVDCRGLRDLASGELGRRGQRERGDPSR